MVLLIAHRGFRVGVLENTFEAFSLAVARGMDYIELDVQLSADREAFVLHDATLDRTMGVAGRLADLTAVQIDAFNAMRGDAGVPRLSDVIRRVLHDPGPGTPNRLMIELKGKETGAVAVELVLTNHIEKRVAFSGQNLDELGIAHDAAPMVPLCLNITSCRAFTTWQLAKATSAADLPLPFAMISLRASEIKQNFIQTCHNLGVKALAWDFLRERRPVALIKHLLNDGLDGVLLDDPGTVEGIRSWIHEKESSVRP